METVLRDARHQACETHAALAVWESMREGGPGIIVDPVALRGFKNHPSDRRQFATTLLSFGQAFTCIFPDQSAVVGRVLANGQYQLAPSLFVLRRYGFRNGQPTFVVKRGKGPMCVPNSLKLEASVAPIFNPRDTEKPIAMDPQTQRPLTDNASLLTAWTHFVQQLEPQVVSIAKTLDKGAWVGMCDGRQLPKTVDEETLKEQGFPPHALGEKLVTPDWLPHNRVNTQTLSALRAYCQDFADWAMMVYGGQGLITRASFRVTSYAPTSVKHTDPFMLHMNGNRNALPGWHPTSISWTAKDLPVDRTRWAPPQLESLERWHFQTTNSFSHTLKTDTLIDVDGAHSLSAHDQLRLMTMFGEGKSII